MRTQSHQGTEGARLEAETSGLLTSNDDRELDGSHIISHFRQLSCGGEAAVRLSKASSPGPRRPFGAPGGSPLSFDPACRRGASRSMGNKRR